MACERNTRYENTVKLETEYTLGDGFFPRRAGPGSRSHQPDSAQWAAARLLCRLCPTLRYLRWHPSSPLEGRYRTAAPLRYYCGYHLLRRRDPCRAATLSRDSKPRMAPAAGGRGA